MKLLIDIKNIAIFGSGISAYIKPILEYWIKKKPEIAFYLVGPTYDYQKLNNLQNCHFVEVGFPYSLPRAIRHPVYDNIIFPRIISKVKPDFIFTPYHDVRLPVAIPSVMMIHDTCLRDLTGLYPFKVRAYYDYMLKVNLKRCSEIITVSESSKKTIVDRYSYPSSKINVVYNTLDSEFFVASNQSLNNKSSFNVLYTGGNEYRKNINRLLDALERLLLQRPNTKLLVTGGHINAWQKNFMNRGASLRNAVHFLGKLSVNELKNAYLSADVVVYPSLCEGFGRACLEAMATGTPIACSDLPVLREVAKDYAVYFDPYSFSDIADKIIQASEIGRTHPRVDERFTQESVINSFLFQMDRILETYCNVK